MSDHQHCPGRHEDTVAVVTGSTHGIGLGTAKRLAREGASVVVNDEGARDGEAVAAELRDLGGDAVYVEADAGDPDAIERLVDRTVEAFGRIDALVNNVGGWDHATHDETDLETWDYVVNATLRSHWLTTTAAAEHMPPGGSVVNISSVHAVQTYPVAFPYNVAKAGVNGLTRTLAIELGPEGIRVNAIMPGEIDTSVTDVDDEALEREAAREPVGRRGYPQDIAAAVAFLASDEAGFIDGAVIPVDGGRTVVLEEDRYADWWEDRV
jgi:NAD(P)-dependent dehydrogenase (short-subunit alcohol dehydrogenase family)